MTSEDIKHQFIIIIIIMGPAYLWVVSLKESTLLGMMAMLEPKLLRVMVIFGTYLYFWG